MQAGTPVRPHLLCSMIAALPLTGFAAGSSGTSTITNIVIDVGRIRRDFRRVDLGQSGQLPRFRSRPAAVLESALHRSASGGSDDRVGQRKDNQFLVNGCACTPWGNSPAVSAVTLN